jgi:hypothetical protein
MKKPRLFAFFNNSVLDFMLIGLGSAIYYHFRVNHLAPFDLHTLVIQLFGGNRYLAVLVISGVFLLVGLSGLLRSSMQYYWAQRDSFHFEVASILLVPFAKQLPCLASINMGSDYRSCAV